MILYQISSFFLFIAIPVILISIFGLFWIYQNIGALGLKIILIFTASFFIILFILLSISTLKDLYALYSKNHTQIQGTLQKVDYVAVSSGASNWSSSRSSASINTVLTLITRPHEKEAQFKLNNRLMEFEAYTGKSLSVLYRGEMDSPVILQIYINP